MDKLSDFKQKLILIIIGVTLAVALLNFSVVWGHISGIIRLFLPLIIGGIFAFVLNVPMSFFERNLGRLHDKTKLKLLKHNRVTSLLLTFIAFFGVITFVAYVVIPNTAQSVKGIMHLVETHYPMWLAFLDNKGISAELIQHYIDLIDFSGIAETIEKNSESIIGVVLGAIGSIFGTIGNISIGLFFSIYILLSKERLGRQAKQIAYAYLRKSWADEVCYICHLTSRTFSKFLSGQCLEAVILGSMFFVVLFIGRFPYAAAISIVIAVTSLIPIVGSFIGAVFGIMLLVAISFKKAVIFLIIFIILQQIEGNAIYPHVVGGSVGLPALWTLLAVIVGGSVAGIGGIILFIPMFSVIYVLIRRNVHKQLDKKGDRLQDVTFEE